MQETGYFSTNFFIAGMYGSRRGDLSSKVRQKRLPRIETMNKRLRPVSHIDSSNATETTTMAENNHLHHSNQRQSERKGRHRHKDDLLARYTTETPAASAFSCFFLTPLIGRGYLTSSFFLVDHCCDFPIVLAASPSASTSSEMPIVSAYTSVFLGK